MEHISEENVLRHARNAVMFKRHAQVHTLTTNMRVELLVEWLKLASEKKFRTAFLAIKFD